MWLKGGADRRCVDHDWFHDRADPYHYRRHARTDDYGADDGWTEDRRLGLFDHPSRNGRAFPGGWH